MLYQEALKSYRQLAKEEPKTYLPDLAWTLNNLGFLVSSNTQRRTEAETFYQKALKSYRQLAKEEPKIYLPDLAWTLNNLGVFSQR